MGIWREVGKKKILAGEIFGVLFLSNGRELGTRLRALVKQR